MAIFILEDHFGQAITLRNLIVEQCQLLDCSSEEIFLFQKCQELLNTATKTLDKNLYFLDLQIGTAFTAGLELAKSIRNFDKNGLIVFVTSHSELLLPSYQIHVAALNFIEKTMDINKFIDEVTACLKAYLELKHETITEEDYFVLKTKSSEIHLIFNEIICFTTNGDHRVLLYATSYSREFYGVLTTIAKSDSRLLRVHHSYLVNPIHMKKIDRKKRKLILSNDMIISISRKYYSAVLNQFVKSQEDVN